MSGTHARHEVCFACMRQDAYYLDKEKGVAAHRNIPRAIILLDTTATCPMVVGWCGV